MRAVLCREYGPIERLTVGELPSPVPGRGEVLVEVHAVGINFTDVLAVEGRSQLKRQLPMVPGVEGAGIVKAVGAGVTKLKPGDRVLGTKAHGAFAEEAVFEEDELAVIPARMSMQQAAAFYIANFTVYHGLVTRADLQAGENLLVLGAGGGVGLVTIEMGKALGARVVAAASSEDKLTLAREKGADAVVLYDRGPLDLEAQKALTRELLRHAERDEKEQPTAIGEISTIKAGSGYHVIMDGVGGSYAEPCLRALGWEGRYLTVGFAAGMAIVPLGPALFKNADIMGIQPSSPRHRLPGRNPEMMQRLFGWYAEGKLHPHISASLPLAQVSTALTMVKERRATGRIVLTTSHHE
ncbi:MAG: NADPH:quinone oxidoreductase family protein [Steroidobacteraceae bacterium]